ncbi:MAG: SPOR domain-containing protein [Myxococcaceae bacterium]
MRDAHRMKEKFDLSLDNRQIVSLLIAGLVVLGSVFVLGVVVGKKLSTQDKTATAPDLLTALDEKAAALNEARDASLTFQEELTRKGPPVIQAPAVHVGASLPEPEALARKAEPMQAEAPRRRPVVAPEVGPVPPEPPEESAETKVETIHLPDPVKVETPTPAAKTQPVATRITQDGGGANKDSAAKRPTETAANGAFTLQLSASQNKAEADRFITKLRDKGYAPFIVTAQVPGKGTWYRVRMGSFANKEAATRYLADFRRETQLDAFVAPSAQ